MKPDTPRHPDAARPDHGRHPSLHPIPDRIRRTPGPGSGPGAGAVEFLTLGLTVAVALVGLGALGYLVDRWLGTSPWFTLVGVVLGIAAAVLHHRVHGCAGCCELARRHRPDRPTGPRPCRGRVARSTVFAHFELPNVPDVARRTVSMVLVVGVGRPGRLRVLRTSPARASGPASASASGPSTSG